MRLTIRTRLTLLYAGLFLAGGAVLLVVAYVVLARSFELGPVRVSQDVAADGAGAPPVVVGRYAGSEVPPEPEPGEVGRLIVAGDADLSGTFSAVQTASLLEEQRAAIADRTLTDFLGRAGGALVLLTVASLGLGWVVSGRVLRPLHRITRTARRLSVEDLDDRLTIAGPRDEIRDLAETFNAMLDRVQDGFERERRFTAMASHELRTPVAVERTVLEVALGDPDRSAERWRRTGRDLLDNAARTERLIETLLALGRARHQGGAEADAEDVDLAELVEERVAVLDGRAAERAVVVRCERGGAPMGTRAHRLLISQLVDNLLHNAVDHNVEAGWVAVVLGASAATVEIANSGPGVPSDLGRLVEPFQRGDPTPGAAPGSGMGLAIVRAVCERYGARLSLAPSPAGGLVVTVAFPPSCAGPARAPTVASMRAGRPRSPTH